MLKLLTNWTRVLKSLYELNSLMDQRPVPLLLGERA